MKKIVALGMTMVMAASVMTGCGKKSSEYLLDVKYSDYVKLCDYKGVEATKVKFDITDEDVQGQIEQELYDYVTYDPIEDRGAEVGDCANITYKATLDGSEAEDYSGEDEDIMIGEGYVYPDMEDALIGMKAGEDKTVEVELTEDYAEEEDVGKKLSVKVTLNELSEENVPEYNEEFVKENTDFDSMEAYEDSLKKQLKESKEEEYKYAAVDDIMRFILDNSEFDGYPQELYDQCKENYDASNEYYASMFGMEVEEYMEMYGMDEEAQKQEIEDSVHYELIIGAIAQAEGIDCTEKEINDFVEDTYADYGYESKDAFMADYTNDDIGYELVYEKVVDFLYENAKYKEISEEEYLQQQNEEMMMETEEESEESLEIDEETEEESEENPETDAETEEESEENAETEEEPEENAETEEASSETTEE